MIFLIVYLKKECSAEEGEVKGQEHKCEYIYVFFLVFECVWI